MEKKLMEKGYEVKHAEQKVVCTKKFLLDSSDKVDYTDHYEIAVVRINTSGGETYLTEHRSNIINHFFKELSGQLIVLSTDEEISNRHLQDMENQIASVYMLEYGSDKRRWGNGSEPAAADCRLQSHT